MELRERVCLMIGTEYFCPNIAIDYDKNKG